MDSTIRTIYSFLRSARGNWRNSIYVTCCQNSRCENSIVGDHILVPDHDGKPIAVTVKDIEAVSGDVIDKNECLATMSCERIRALYDLWLAWNTDTEKACISGYKSHL